ncbi:MAG TPA: hypothetical protein VL137_16400 [Polyangiaceae bacterium]|nr:hypothetical protein [Polyangiaceae bacterium]
MGDEQVAWSQLVRDLAIAKSLPDLEDRVHWVYLFELKNAPCAGTAAAKTLSFLGSKDPSGLDAALKNEIKHALERIQDDRESVSYLRVLQEEQQTH